MDRRGIERRRRRIGVRETQHKRDGLQFAANLSTILALVVAIATLVVAAYGINFLTRIGTLSMTVNNVDGRTDFHSHCTLSDEKGNDLNKPRDATNGTACQWQREPNGIYIVSVTKEARFDPSAVSDEYWGSITVESPGSYDFVRHAPYLKAFEVKSQPRRLEVTAFVHNGEEERLQVRMTCAWDLTATPPFLLSVNTSAVEIASGSQGRLDCPVDLFDANSGYRLRFGYIIETEYQGRWRPTDSWWTDYRFDVP